MNLFIIKDIILNLILITFPILVYLVLVCYRENIDNNNKDTLLTIALITSLYLCLKYIPSEINTKVLLFCNIPIVIAYMKKKHYLGIFLSIMNVLYSYYVLNIEVIIMIIKYASYLGLYLCARKKNLTSDSFILSIAIIQGFFLSFEYFFKDIKASVNDFVLLLIIVFIYYFATFSILYLFKVMDKIESLNTTIKMLEKDKKIKSKKKVEDKKMEKTLTIEGMMCGHCEARVKKALEALPEVKEAVVSHEAGTAVVTLESAVSDEALKEAVEAQDYKVISVQ